MLQKSLKEFCKTNDYKIKLLRAIVKSLTEVNEYKVQQKWGNELLKSFIDDKLFTYLKSFRQNTENTNTLEYKIGEIFHEIKNKLSDGYSIREVVNAVDNLEFKSSEQKHELSALYEEKIKNMGNSGRNGGEYYTPRALIKSIIQVINPKINETVYL